MTLGLQLTAKAVCGVLVGHGTNLQPVPGSLGPKIGLANEGLVAAEEARVFLLRVGEVR